MRLVVSGLPVGVVDELLVQRLRDALRHAAVDLPFHQHVVQHGPAVVDGDVAHEPRLARLDVHLDDGDVTSETETSGRPARNQTPRPEPSPRSQVRPAQRRGRHARDAEPPIRHPHDVLGARLQAPRRLLPRLLDQRDARAAHSAAAELQRPRSRRARRPWPPAPVSDCTTRIAVHRHAEKPATPAARRRSRAPARSRWCRPAITIEPSASARASPNSVVLQHRRHLDVRAQVRCRAAAVSPRSRRARCSRRSSS